VGDLVRWIRATYPGGPVILAGHSLGAAAALAAPTDGVAALALVDPAGLVRLRVSPRVLRSTLPWLLRPTEARSRALIQHMLGPGGRPDSGLVDWMTLVARHTRVSGAPGPFPAPITARWHSTPRVVMSGEHDCFLPPPRLGPAARTRLGIDLTVLAGLGHLTVAEDPPLVAAGILAVSARE